MTLTLPAYPIQYLEVTFLEDNEHGYEIQTNKQILPFGVSEIFFAPIKSSKTLAEGEDVKTVQEINFNLKDSNLEYEPGQTIGILPKNNTGEVEEIIERLNLKDVAKKFFKVSVKKDCTKKNAKIPPHIPIISNIYETLINNLDIRSIPRKLFLRALTKYTTDEEEINILNELCSTQGTAKYNDFISNYMPLLELLKKFKSCLPPFSLLLEHLPKLQPRPYSVSSSPKNPTELKIVYSLEILPHSYKGVCTGWLNEILKNVSEITVPIYLRKPNDFKLPEDSATNIILVATGTGIAPFMSFLEHLNGKESEIVLFYGCRYSDQDFLFKKEINSFVELGVLSKLFMSFSRENNEVKYVQDNIRNNGKMIVGLLDKNSVIYVCGSAKMCKDVFETVVSCLCNEKKYADEGRKELVELKKQKKYVEDVWT